MRTLSTRTCKLRLKSLIFRLSWLIKPIKKTFKLRRTTTIATVSPATTSTTRVRTVAHTSPPSTSSRGHSMSYSRHLLALVVLWPGLRVTMRAWMTTSILMIRNCLMMKMSIWIKMIIRELKMTKWALMKTSKQGAEVAVVRKRQRKCSLMRKRRRRCDACWSLGVHQPSKTIIMSLKLKRDRMMFTLYRHRLLHPLLYLQRIKKDQS